MQARKKKVLTILCIGSAILVWRGYALIARYAPSEAQADPTATMIDPAQVMPYSDQNDEDMQATWEEQRRIAALPWGRNPCASPVLVTTVGADRPIAPTNGQPPPAPKITLSGVSRSGDQWLAAVKGTIIRVGDEFEGFRVIKIGQHSITLESAGWTFTYAMGAETAVVQPSPEVK